MPGPNIARYLAPQNYSTFYRLVHNYSETILRPCASIAMYADQIIRVLNQLPVTEQMAAVPPRRAATELQNLAQETSDAVRAYFFPRSPNECASLAEFDAYYQARWSPFSGADWDVLLDDFLALLIPYGVGFENALVQLEQIPQFTQDVESGISKATVNSILHRCIGQIRLAQQKLTIFSQPEEFDHFVRDPEYFRTKYGF